MLVLVATLLAILSPSFAGGKLARLADVHLRCWWLLLGALAAQVVIIEVVPEAQHGVLVAVHLATYIAAGLFVVANWRVPGLPLIAAGGACNAITIALNGGTLPASADALERAGIHVVPGEFVNSGVLANPTLAWFGDVFAWPAPLPLANVFSIGDVLIVLGALYGAHKITGTRFARRPWIASPSPEEQDASRQVQPAG